MPDGPITVGIDGGYVRDWEAKKHHFEVIVGKPTVWVVYPNSADNSISAKTG